MSAPWGPTDDRPQGRGTIDPGLAAVGYPDEYRPLATDPTTPLPVTGSAESATGAARHEAGEIADTAKDAGTQVVQSAKEQVGEVTKEAGRQARDLMDQLRTEASDQAATQQQRAAGGLRSLADELSGMAGRSEQDGPATDLARQAADRLQDVAEWLEDRDPGSVLDEVRSFARRRPGAYLALAAGAGLLAGRLTRGLTSHDNSSGHSAPAAGSTTRNGVAETSALDWELERRSAMAPPPVGIRPEPSLTQGAVPPPGVVPGAIGRADQPISSFTPPPPPAGSAGDLRR